MLLSSLHGMYAEGAGEEVCFVIHDQFLALVLLPEGFTPALDTWK